LQDLSGGGSDRKRRNVEELQEETADIFRAWKMSNRVPGKQSEALVTLLRNNTDYHEFAGVDNKSENAENVSQV
jgi:hypothetical protein